MRYAIITTTPTRAAILKYLSSPLISSQCGPSAAPTYAKTKQNGSDPSAVYKGESLHVHPDDAGGIGDNRADDRKQSTDENGAFPVLCKPLLAAVKLTLAYEHVFAVAFE